MIIFNHWIWQFTSPALRKDVRSPTFERHFSSPSGFEAVELHSAMMWWWVFLVICQYYLHFRSPWPYRTFISIIKFGAYTQSIRNGWHKIKMHVVISVGTRYIEWRVIESGMKKVTVLASSDSCYLFHAGTALDRQNGRKAMMRTRTKCIKATRKRLPSDAKETQYRNVFCVCAVPPSYNRSVCVPT